MGSAMIDSSKMCLGFAFWVKVEAISLSASSQSGGLFAGSKEKKVISNFAHRFCI
jgi:hypothetical protein